MDTNEGNDAKENDRELLYKPAPSSFGIYVKPKISVVQLKKDIKDIRELFNYISINFVEELIINNCSSPNYVKIIIEHLLSLDGKYPTNEEDESEEEKELLQGSQSSANLEQRYEKPEAKIQIVDETDPKKESEKYIQAAFCFMKNEFPQFHCLLPMTILTRNEFNLKIAWKILWKLQKQMEIEDYKEEFGEQPSSSTKPSKSINSTEVIKEVPKDITSDFLRKCHVKIPFPQTPLPATVKRLADDVKALQKMIKRKRESRARRIEGFEAKKALLAERPPPNPEAAALWFLVECPSCYDEVAGVSCVECAERHAICLSCFKQEVQHCVGMRKAVLRCFADSDCSQTYSFSTVRSALNGGELFQQWAQLASLQEVRKSGMNCFFCPFCQYPEEIQSNVPLPPIFRCRKRRCRKLICTICNKEAHKEGEKCPKLVEEENESSLIRHVQMAIDQRWIRYCPSCHVAIVKKKGCNHIRCVCEYNFCCVCRKGIDQDNPSTHFGQPPTFCKQFTDQDEDDERELTEAAREAEKEWRAKHPEYKGDPIQLKELTQMSIERRRAENMEN
ncbi:putative E3 ubiquitin-protein ligase RNF216 [Monocercomonoides exilis]|uniref:putative E3 ubiquitin-protein ligase RNF216 n=1 Tax=Monocercomonoides exilis TaxID=2049356 RepID=UPI00355A4894|nr:putative E3 ubiquitin-protein ligase RNF216 [Monocercomonoides exilis]|eukprot:MONOS_13348.1-p1 / transcript=MONOS_13348.1 / gene=MONOS_13348 / organism=Monocercomonoides_exilis_PA203 / gene_product=E3 ubiquitin-protein ligase RNF216 / transcript_product=E3 ubiquitin-protein ligase RNF216 / location=Mono_scaffold00813:27136-28821(+) / protein_length=561 / sequence_SO=supercontig / SO=protein_coding / is_pseudo=false